MTEAPREQKRPLRPPIREVTPTGILRWLRLGFRDLFKAGWPSLAHGLIVTAISLVIIGITFLFWPLLPGAVSGFLVVGPVLDWRYYCPVTGRVVAIDRSASDALRITLDRVWLTDVPLSQTPHRVRLSLHATIPGSRPSVTKGRSTK